MCNVRVMTFNVRGARGPEDDGPNAWPERRELNLRTIRRHRPDLIGFQECQPGNLETYQAELTEYDFAVGVPTSNPDPGRHEYNAIFWRRERFERLDQGSYWLSHTPHTWSEAWETACVRGANWVRLRCDRHGPTFIYLNTHLDHVSALARQEGSRLILQRLAELNVDDQPVIISGDFNATPQPPQPGDPPTCHALFTAAGFVDSYLAAGQQDTVAANTFHNFQGAAFTPRFTHVPLRIDWILVRGGRRSLQTIACRIIRDAEPPLYPSDHYPVLAELTIG